MNFGILTFLSDQKFDFFSLARLLRKALRPAQTGKGLDSNKIKVIIQGSGGCNIGRNKIKILFILEFIKNQNYLIDSLIIKLFKYVYCVFYIFLFFSNQQSMTKEVIDHTEQVWNSLLIAVGIMALIILPQYFFTLTTPKRYTKKND